MGGSGVDLVTHACRCWCSSPTAKDFRRIVVGEEHQQRRIRQDLPTFGKLANQFGKYLIT